MSPAFLSVEVIDHKWLCISPAWLGRDGSLQGRLPEVPVRLQIRAHRPPSAAGAGGMRSRALVLEIAEVPEALFNLGPVLVAVDVLAG